MRPIEFSILLTLLLRVIGPFLTAPGRWLNYLSLVAVALVGLHLLVEGPRWQMVPIYVIVAALLLFSLRPMLRPQPGDVPARGLPILAGGLVLTAAAAVLPFLFPVPSLPDPTGPYPVGTFNWELTDEQRREIYAGEGSDLQRRLILRVWYPAGDVAGLERSPWIDDARVVAPAVAEWVHLPRLITSHLGMVRSQSYLDATVASGTERYPVVLFSHGWGGFRTQTSFLMQELASQGYVVVAVEHPYASMVTVFSDGTVAQLNPDTLPFGKPDDEFLAAARQTNQQWMLDLKFVLDTLEQLEAGALADAPAAASGLAGRLELEHVGVSGHSNGGGAAVGFCASDARCKAVLGLDAYLLPVWDKQRQHGLDQPALFLFSESWPSETNWRLLDELEANSRPFDTFIITGTAHYDFSDLPGVSPLSPVLGLKGPLPSRRVMEIVNAYALAFFDASLKGKAVGLPVGFDEVRGRE